MAQDSKIMRVYTELPSWAKGVVVVGGLVVTYLAASTIITSVKSAINKKKSQQEIDTANSDLQAEINAGRKQTLSNSTLEAMASGIVVASNGCGTNEDIIVGNFDNLQNEADMLAFVKVFGLRQKQRCPFTTDDRENPWCAWDCLTKPMSLSTMIYSELSQGWVDTLNKKLASRGIKYRF
jgi:hypothetical protein